LAIQFAVNIQVVGFKYQVSLMDVSSDDLNSIEGTLLVTFTKCY